jgi:hypothetical protein
MVAKTLVTVRAVRASCAFGVGGSAFGGARLPNVRNPSRAPIPFRKKTMRYLVAPAEPWLFGTTAPANLVDTGSMARPQI